ncbi:MAG: hypothetical protein N2652_01695 [Kiritimatiellae bacterium]|nr:hypothetical protein [Kiritimatiellia bacterium]
MTGRVIRYRRRPSRTALLLAMMCWLTGAVVAAWWQAPERVHLPEARRRAAAALAVGGVTGGWIIVMATAHLWFPHLRARTR